jgi:hypothetical protein
MLVREDPIPAIGEIKHHHVQQEHPVVTTRPPPEEPAQRSPGVVLSCFHFSILSANRLAGCRLITIKRSKDFWVFPT